MFSGLGDLRYLFTYFDNGNSFEQLLRNREGISFSYLIYIQVVVGINVLKHGCVRFVGGRGKISGQSIYIPLTTAQYSVSLLFITFLKHFQQSYFNIHTYPFRHTILYEIYLLLTCYKRFLSATTQ